MVEPWIAPLQASNPERAWDLFIERYRRLIFGAIRRYTGESDDAMDVFARVCEVLRENDFARLRRSLGARPPTLDLPLYRCSQHHGRLVPPSRRSFPPFSRRGRLTSTAATHLRVRLRRRPIACRSAFVQRLDDQQPVEWIGVMQRQIAQKIAVPHSHAPLRITFLLVTPPRSRVTGS